ncbi:MAG: type I methionyl aminopeptidase [Coriobacteriales bacterium]
MAVTHKSPAEIEAMKAAGSLSRKALRLAGQIIRPGISTLEIDQYVEEIIRMGGGVPAFKGYMGFPGSICASINDEVVHGIPSAHRTLQEGDIISIDTGAIVDGWVGDNAHTYAVGEIDPRTQELLEVTEKSLYAGIEQAVVGNHLRDIGHAVQAMCEKAGFGVIREYVGHGVGHHMHEEPNVPNYGKRGQGMRLEEGMVIAIEPMITQGTYHVHTLDNGWTVVTDDGLPSAHFENTIAITADGPVILTKE